jgi:hypothetical protein
MGFRPPHNRQPVGISISTTSSTVASNSAPVNCTAVVLPLVVQLDHAAQYSPSDPDVRKMTEEAREAHWKLTAPKGFAALKVRAVPKRAGWGWGGGGGGVSIIRCELVAAPS